MDSTPPPTLSPSLSTPTFRHSITIILSPSQIFSKMPPQWFTPRFIKRISTVAPPEVLPLAILQDLAIRYSTARVDNEVDGSERDSRLSSNSGHSLSNNSSHHLFKDTSRDELVQMETSRRAHIATNRLKQLWIWGVARFG